MPRAIDRRVGRLERRQAAEEFDPVKANKVAVECYDAGLPLPDTLTPPELVIARAIYQTLWYFDRQWSDEPLRLPNVGHGQSQG
jgi:hypothetical protein